MLNYLFSYLSSEYSFLNVFRYITFRTGVSIFTSLTIVLLLGGPFINYLKSSKHFDQPIRNDGPISHIINKIGTPTFGGVLIIFATLFTSLLWADLKNLYVLISLFAISAFALIGFFDDYLKIKNKNSNGIPAKFKFLIQILISIMIVYLINISTSFDIRNILHLPFYKNLVFDLGIFYIFFGVIVIVGTSNAVNLTDGLDGLATMPVLLVALTFILITYMVGNMGVAMINGFQQNDFTGTEKVIACAKHMIGGGESIN